MTRDADTVRAFVDGELDDLTAARIAREAQGDPELASAIAAERRLRDTLGTHFNRVLAEPVPERLSAPVEAARKVVSLDEARQRRFGFNARTLRWAGPAMAAALVLAVAIPALQRGGQTESRDSLTFAANDLAQALDTQLVADQRQGSETRVLLSFADQDGTLCRGFARADLSGIACREDGGWHLRVQRDGVDLSANDYRQAGSVDSAILAAAQDMAAGPALDAAGERAARASGWKRR
ncbi:anti-sigma factor [Tsuneonella sp. YG55]|uniref:Anti-sigma factor n=1 Tax=Tsuneonella litorea TaxID=2976475 RepID=A0A9X2W189_9SPHN|nr:anti-sigma factor [Tsuneonella litorea]MCT2558674.1 anti-sigma factor [Tsuneonella litorea]